MLTASSMRYSYIQMDLDSLNLALPGAEPKILTVSLANSLWLLSVCAAVLSSKIGCHATSIQLY